MHVLTPAVLDRALLCRTLCITSVLAVCRAGRQWDNTAMRAGIWRDVSAFEGTAVVSSSRSAPAQYVAVLTLSLLSTRSVSWSTHPSSMTVSLPLLVIRVANVIACSKVVHDRVSNTRDLPMKGPSSRSLINRCLCKFVGDAGSGASTSAGATVRRECTEGRYRDSGVL